MERNSAAGDWGRYTIYQPAKVATILGRTLTCPPGIWWFNPVKPANCARNR